MLDESSVTTFYIYAIYVICFLGNASENITYSMCYEYITNLSIIW